MYASYHIPVTVKEIAMAQVKGNLMQHTRLARVSPTSVCACKGHTHAKRITVTGNDVGSLHTIQFFIQVCLFYTT